MVDLISTLELWILCLFNSFFEKKNLVCYLLTDLISISIPVFFD